MKLRQRLILSYFFVALVATVLAGAVGALLQVYPDTTLADRSFTRLPLLLVAMVVILSIALILAWYFSKKVSRPLLKIMDAAREIAGGDYDAINSIDETDDEIGELAGAFKTMAQDVQSAQKAQRDLLSNISHSLRTPLTSIQGFSQALMDETVQSDDEQERIARIIHEESSRLTRLVQQILVLARIEDGTFSMSEEETDLRTLLEHIEHRYGSVAEARGIRFDVRRPRKSLPVIGDPGRLEQALTNLLDNAFRHASNNGRDGEVRLIGKLGGVRGTNGEEGAGGVLGRWWVELVVSDNGPGIDGEETAHLFDRFYLADANNSEAGGFELAIAREIVQAHGGEISVDSDAEGTTFQVRLPMNMGY